MMLMLMVLALVGNWKFILAFFLSGWFSNNDLLIDGCYCAVTCSHVGAQHGPVHIESHDGKLVTVAPFDPSHYRSDVLVECCMRFSVNLSQVGELFLLLEIGMRLALGLGKSYEVCIL